MHILTMPQAAFEKRVRDAEFEHKVRKDMPAVNVAPVTARDAAYVAAAIFDYVAFVPPAPGSAVEHWSEEERAKWDGELMMDGIRWAAEADRLAQ